MDFKLVHSMKQLSPIEVTEGGIVMEVKLLQLLKHLFPIVVRDKGSVMEVNFLQLLYLLSVDYQYYTL